MSAPNLPMKPQSSVPERTKRGQWHQEQTQHRFSWLHARVRPLRIGVVGNHLPRQCGIATFTTDLCDAIAAEFSGE